jgi:hypothetical protein
VLGLAPCSVEAAVGGRLLMLIVRNTLQYNNPKKKSHSDLESKNNFLTRLN